MPSFIRVRNRINLARKQINTDCLRSVANKLAVLAQPDTHRRSACQRMCSVSCPSPFPSSVMSQLAVSVRIIFVAIPFNHLFILDLSKMLGQSSRVSSSHQNKRPENKCFFLFLFLPKYYTEYKQINYVIFSLKLT